MVWLRQLLRELGVPVLGPTLLNADNTCAIQIASNYVFHKTTKHIEVDCHFIRQHLLLDILDLLHVFSQNQLANLFTKAMPRPRHDFLIAKLMLYPTPHQFEGECRSRSLSGPHDSNPGTSGLPRIQE